MKRTYAVAAGTLAVAGIALVAAYGAFIYFDGPRRVREAVQRVKEAKRDVFRWGCASEEAEYKGYEALPPASAEALAAARAASAQGADGGVFTPFNRKQVPWEVLQVSESASKGVVDAAFRDLVKKAHPDQGGSTDAFARLTEARAAMHALIDQRENGTVPR